MVRGILGGCLAESPSAELRPDEVYRKALPGIATLEIKSARGPSLVGTAFLALEADTGVTAWHLVREARSVTARFADGESCPVTGVLDWDEVKDIALVRLACGSRPRSPLCLTPPPVGTKAYVIGAPRGYPFSLSDGLVSQVQTVDGFAQYQMTGPISPGNSGGPLLNARGEVLGVVAWSKNEAQNLNFATPAVCLPALNARAKETLWHELAAARRLRRQVPAAGEPPPRARAAEVEDAQLRELRETLRRLGGRSVTISVGHASGAQRFTVTLPENFVR